MIPLRSLFASVLLVVVLAGGALGPTVHWASHGLWDHEDHSVEVTDGLDHAAPVTETGHAGECPDCAHLQKTLSSEPDAQPFYADLVGLERSVVPPEAPAVQNDVATPEGRGPPMAA